jgi:hypothetical protein
MQVLSYGFINPSCIYLLNNGLGDKAMPNAIGVEGGVV